MGDVKYFNILSVFLWQQCLVVSCILLRYLPSFFMNHKRLKGATNEMNPNIHITNGAFKNRFKILQYNVDQAMREEAHEATKWAKRSSRIKALIEQVDADIVCLQEFRRLSGSRPEEFLASLDKYRYTIHYRASSPLSFGQAILYKPDRFFPIETMVKEKEKERREKEREREKGKRKRHRGVERRERREREGEREGERRRKRGREEEKSFYANSKVFLATSFGVDLLSGEPTGYFYAATFSTLFSIIDGYVRVTGELSSLHLQLSLLSLLFFLILVR